MTLRQAATDRLVTGGLLLVVLSCTSGRIARNQDEGQTSRLEPEAPRIQTSFAPALQRAAGIRQLEPSRDVRMLRVSPELVAQRAVQLSRLYAPKATRDAQVEFGTAFGLLPRGFDLDHALLELCRAYLLGIYDPERQSVLLSNRPSANEERRELHELVHALQDQHFRVSDRLEWTPGGGDAVAALQSFAEGDASLAEQVAGLTNETAEPVAPPNAVPRLLLASSAALYADGLLFAEALYQKGGWEAVNSAWRDPPQSTEQLLHLEKYARRERWSQLDGATLPGCSELHWDTIGEQGLRLVLEEWIHADLARRLAEGWDGDRATIHDCDGSRHLSWELAFDSPSDAREFAEALRRASPQCRTTGAHWTVERLEQRVYVVASAHWPCPKLRSVASDWSAVRSVAATSPRD
jgi:hypothetical protein